MYAFNVYTSNATLKHDSIKYDFYKKILRIRTNTCLHYVFTKFYEKYKTYHYTIKKVIKIPIIHPFYYIGIEALTQANH